MKNSYLWNTLISKIYKMVAKQITITGHVQGVGFRYYIYKKAHMLGIKGFVRNEPDGTVYVEAYADDQDAMDAFIDYLKRGPSMARVENVFVTDIPAQDFKEFSIR